MSETNTLWAYYYGKWIEAFKAQNGVVYAKDPRITTEPLRGDIRKEKPELFPLVGEKIIVQIRRTFQVTETDVHSGFYPEALWGEIDSDLEEVKIASVEVLRVQGFEHTHRCGWCEEFAATNPPPDSRCRGCRNSLWDEWDDEGPAIGMQPKPSWAL